MNLLKTDTYEVVPVARSPPPYAILSHRWEAEEITYESIKTLKLSALRDPSFPLIPANLRSSAAKVRGACAMAQRQGLKYIWIDTCCIDKSSSEELRFSLNSMFQWYHDAAVCYTFLNDVTFNKKGENMFMSDQPKRSNQASEWFERGWTLQELLAPRNMLFFDKHWRSMGTRTELAMLVSRLAGISPEYLNGQRDVRKASCATRMSWMAGRVTTVVEDIAYSMLGLFDIQLVPQYGEGTKAFHRLQEAIMNDYGCFDESLFAWERPQDSLLRCYRNEPKARKFPNNKWGLIAPSPDCFQRSGNIFVHQDLVQHRVGGGFRRSHQGIVFSLPSKEVNHSFGGGRSEVRLPLNCWKVGSNRAPETIVLKLSRVAGPTFVRVQCDQLGSEKGAKVDSKGSAIIAVSQPQIGQDIGNRSSEFR